MTQDDLKINSVVDIGGTKAYLLEVNGEKGVGFYGVSECKKKAVVNYLINEGWLDQPKYGWITNKVQISER